MTALIELERQRYGSMFNKNTTKIMAARASRDTHTHTAKNVQTPRRLILDELVELVQVNLHPACEDDYRVGHQLQDLLVELHLLRLDVHLELVHGLWLVP